jgi:hypothetical protein
MLRCLSALLCTIIAYPKVLHLICAKVIHELILLAQLALTLCAL